ncbi:hypothetical protein CASFOL_036931 [Castilleja foliolosa]|uniref:Uncharacterized protein n=1 Tax=Castilleja foliolosa TaxID=1961234 RepID=A0ABD3BQT7_9LAMI
MALNLGYEYYLDVSIDNNIEALAISNLGVESKVYIFKLRTKFKVLRKLDDDDMYDCEMMETESLTATFCVHPNGILDDRLPNPDPDSSLAQSRLTNLVRRSLSPNSSYRHGHVCTMQLDGETIHEAFKRSVRPDSLTPLELVLPMEKENKLCRRRRVSALRSAEG